MAKPPRRVPIPGADDDITGSRSEKRVLTALSYDLVGSTELLERLGIEDYHELVTSFQRGVKQTIAANAGVPRTEAGDGGMALFLKDMAARDAASLAVSAALEIVSCCVRLGRDNGISDLRVRVGVATSQILVQEGDDQLNPDVVTGPALSMATRLQSIAAPNSVLVANETRLLVRRSHVFSFQGSLHLKGFAEPQNVWRALRHRPQIDRFYAFGRIGTQLIDREAELERLKTCWREVLAGKGQVVLVEGKAGIGKSRLIHEFRRVARSQISTLLVFQCQPGGARSTLQPLLHSMPAKALGGDGRLTLEELARRFSVHGIVDPEVVRVFAYLLGVEGPEEGFEDLEPDVIRDKVAWAVRSAIGKICATGPLIIAVEDIHWIDPTSRQILLEIAAFVEGHPLLLAMTGRPGSASEWRDAPHLDIIALEALRSEDTRQAIELMLPNSKSIVSSDFNELIERITGGVPLFIEQLCQWIEESSQTAMESLASAGAVGPVPVLEDIIEARLNGLGDAMEVARAAAVAGSRFTCNLLAQLMPNRGDLVIAAALDNLSEAGFITPAHPSRGAVYSFRHSLVQETIYNAMLRKSRRHLHDRLLAAVDRDRKLAAWMTTASLADHAERAERTDRAVDLLITAGGESSSRSAMMEARQLLEHAIELSDKVIDPVERIQRKLKAMAALGPVLTSSLGPNSPPARKLYEDGVQLARQRPTAERALWFPIYWGWWFTGSDVNGERARAVLHDLKDVEDTEVQMQARHCVWAIEFYLGHHDRCIAAVEEGLSLYGGGGRPENAVLYGGHDARVCGLAHLGLSQWFTGNARQAVKTLAEARAWAESSWHVGNMAHVYLNSAMLNCYRRDLPTLHKDISDIRGLTAEHNLPSLTATAQILEGWCDGIEGNAARGRAVLEQGLDIHGELQTPEDYPVYCGLLAEIMARTGDFLSGLQVLTAAVAAGEQTGHRYWLAELHRRRASLLYLSRADPQEVLAAIHQSLDIASEQNAVPILLIAYETLRALQLSPDLAERYRERVELARAVANTGGALFVNPESAIMDQAVE